MNYTTLWLILLFAVVLLSVTYAAFTRFGLFFTWPWLDVPMHILGGFVVGLGIFLAYSKNHTEPLTGLPLLGLVVGGALVVGIGWELFEIIFALTSDTGLTYNSLKDLTMDVVGGVLVIALIHYSSLVQVGAA